MPTSGLLFLLWMMRRKNSCPLGRRMWLDDGFIDDVSTSSPLRYHVISGGGSPVAMQFNVSGCFFATYLSFGCSMMRGFVICSTPEDRKESFIYNTTISIKPKSSGIQAHRRFKMISLGNLKYSVVNRWIMCYRAK